MNSFDSLQAELAKQGLGIPKGARLIEAWEHDGHLIVTGIPVAHEDEEAGHNCDTMGCSSASHVVLRVPIPSGVLVDGALKPCQ